MKRLQKSWIFSSALILFFGFTATVYAQEMPPSQPEQQMPSYQEEQQMYPSQQEQQMPSFQQESGVREDFSKKELQKFVSAATKAQEVQQERQQEIINAIEEEDLDVNRFNEIMAVRQGKDKKTEVSDEEMQSFNAAAQKVIEHQRMMQTEIAEAIEEEDITIDTYQQIALAYQQSPRIQKKITKILEKEEEQ